MPHCQPHKRRKGHLIHSGPYHVPGLPETHRITAYIPPSYADSERAYPVAIFFDGQNLFSDEGSFRGGWHLHDLLDERDCMGQRVPIVVAIHTGGLSRTSILSPWTEDPDIPPLGDRLIEWVVSFLLPEIRKEVRILPGPEHTLIGGASLGALVSLFAFFRHPETFGRVLAMSPSLGVSGGRLGPIIPFIEQAQRPLGKIYLDAGGRECPCGHVLRHAESLAELLAHKGYVPGQHLRFHPDPAGDHDEWHWRRRMPGALNFMCDAPQGDLTYAAR